MNERDLGKTGIAVSELGFGCGSVGGLMIRGSREDRVRAVARAHDAGITYFDTARSYGDGQSETNLGTALRELDLHDSAVVGTKVVMRAEDMPRIEEAVAEQIDGCLSRLGRDQVDVIYLHNQIVVDRDPDRGRMGVSDIETAATALRRAVEQGKTRSWGLNGLGDTAAIHEAVLTTRPDVIQSCYNMLNPTSIESAPTTFPFQDYDRLIDHATGTGIGVAAIRILAAGALSGKVERHPTAMPKVGPIATSSDYASDVARASSFQYLVDEGITTDLIEAAIRFALAGPGISTALVGLASLDQLEHAIASAEKGPLPAEILTRIRNTQSTFR